MFTFKSMNICTTCALVWCFIQWLCIADNWYFDFHRPVSDTTVATSTSTTGAGFNSSQHYTDYHAKLWAAFLTLHGETGQIEKLSRPLSNSRVDLNPHQIEAALFAIQSPLSKGAVLADEVGLGKTIEAGLVIAQHWAERRRRVLLIVPATLRKQWQQELIEKFSIRSVILEQKDFKQAAKKGGDNPFLQKDLAVIVSYNFAARRSKEIASVPWDLVVIDEAHRLRNVYKPDSKIPAAIRDATRLATKKLLLTATPLQNNLIELYGLASIVDPNLFGDEKSFRELFMPSENGDDRFGKLRQRLQKMCKRTLRKQVLEYIRFTRREAITQDFSPSDAEQELYDKVSDYLRRDDLVALPKAIRSLITMVLRKLLASSTRAIAGTLRGLVQRLEAKAAELLNETDFETLGDLVEEWKADGDTVVDVDPARLKEELDELRRYAEMAEQITTNAKGEKLLAALPNAFARAVELGAKRKAVIFTESRRTQGYLFELLIANGYSPSDVVLISGSNDDAHSREIYERWSQRHHGTDMISGSKSANMKAATVEEFRDSASILLATESAAEGVNLQFCSLVVNYDLPWNPQRVEQRIGRCHRYGQKHDVVVLNFLNTRNAADRRVLELLTAKFHLFQGVFGASDEILGVIESGVDIERRIAGVYQTCRTSGEIEKAFDALQAQFDEKITDKLAEARRDLLENFDEEVVERLRVHKDEAQQNLDDHQRYLWSLTRRELNGAAQFEREEPSFTFQGRSYHLDWRKADANGQFFYSSDCELAQNIIKRASDRKLPIVELVFDYAAYDGKISELEALVGCRGWLDVSILTVKSIEYEEILFFAGYRDKGVNNFDWCRNFEPLNESVCRKLFMVPARKTVDVVNEHVEEGISSWQRNAIRAKQAEIEGRNGKHFDEEVAKLDTWADDLKGNLEREIQAMDQKIEEARAKARTSLAIGDKIEAQKELRELERRRNEKRRELYEKQDGIDHERDRLIRQTETRISGAKHEIRRLFMVRWILE